MRWGRTCVGVAAVLAAGVLAAACSGSASLGAADASCGRSPDAEQRDVDYEDSPETPFGQSGPGEPVAVRFENANLEPDLWAQVGQAVELWSPSRCLQLDTGTCTGDVGCVRVRAHSAEELNGLVPTEDWTDTDGLFDGENRGAARIGGTITLNLTLFDEMNANGRLVTIAHEMGHAFGLRHRRDDDAMMNADTSDETDPRPDRTDFANLRAIYGAVG
ncbi:MAG: matrixin family metalloprotease [Sporichthyaceae bacterium]